VRTIVVIALLAVFASGAYAQFNRDYTGVLTYGISIPTADTKEWISDASFRGFGFHGRRMISDNTSWGVSWDWSTFNMPTDGTIQIDNGAVTGHQHRIMYSMPILVNYHYYFKDAKVSSDETIPFVGIGAGTYWIKQVLEIGVIAIEDSNWHFGISPDFGVKIPVSFYSDLVVGARYNYAFESGNTPSQSYWTLYLGLGYSR